MEIVASTRPEADAHLEDLREKRGVRRGGELGESALVESLDEALNILSDQLYKASTHFILELIQNADDNRYSVATVPNLRLILYNEGGTRYFRSDCNEVGFTFKQLDALSRVGKSTKAAITNSNKGYIGEKGIGFKSVFKVADVVHVASGFYEFKFDRNAPIGMILPIPCHFPTRDRAPGHTQFLLELNRERHYDDIRRDLDSIQPDLLLFLRKLDRISISLPGCDRQYQREIVKSDPTYNGESIIIRTHGDTITSTQHVVHRHTASDLPSDRRRKGIHSSEVVIAFKVQDEVMPLSNTQDVFAFLPINDFGFRFLIHADFLLVASREDLDYSSNWNWALQSAVKTAVVTAIQRLAALPPTQDGNGLCYTWPRYLPRQARSSGSFWNELHRNILNDLREQDLLISRLSSRREKPTNLCYVPVSYRFGGEEIFQLPAISCSHLSFEYDNVIGELTLIGLKTLSVSDLCQEFQDWILKVGIDGLGGQSVEWHRKISQIFKDQNGLREKLRDFPIVPLRDGTWTSARQSCVFFPSRDSKEHVPVGIELSLVHRSASDDPVRRSFLSFLGVQEYKPAQVCELIVDLHRKLFRSSAASRAEDDLVSDALYLFNHQSHFGSKVPNIYFAVRKGGSLAIDLNCCIYLTDPSTQPDLIAKYRDAEGSPFRVLSDKYLAELCKDRQQEYAGLFLVWLRMSPYTEFSTTPVLWRNNSLSAEWYFLHDHNVIDLLQAIRLYRRSTLYTPSMITKATKLLQIPCRDGITRPLCLLALPTPELELFCPHLDFANIPDPTSNDWYFLAESGILTTVNTDARLRELEKLAELPAGETRKEAVQEIYELLNCSTDSKWQNIRVAFSRHSLVFITRPTARWLSHTECVWDGPDALKSVIRLRSRYPRCKHLFRSILYVDDASTKHVVEELCGISHEGTEAVQRFNELFPLLERYRTPTRPLTWTQVQQIKGAVMFPILATGASSESLRSSGEGEWYIPDRVTLETAFKGRVNLLSMPVKVVRSLHNLFQALGLQHKYLSAVVEETTELGGRSIRDLQREDDLATRLQYVRLALGVSPSGERLAPRVWSVPSISNRSRLGTIEIIHKNGLLMFKDDEGFTDLYIREEISQEDQPRLHYELVEYFLASFNVDVDAKRIPLVNYLMSAPISELPRMMERFDMALPDTSNDAIAHSHQSDEEEQASTFEHRIEYSRETTVDRTSLLPSVDLERQFGNLQISRIGSGNDEYQVPCPSSPRRALLQEAIPSHRATRERISEQASLFQVAEAVTARAPTSSAQFRGSLPWALPGTADEAQPRDPGLSLPVVPNFHSGTLPGITETYASRSPATHSSVSRTPTASGRSTQSPRERPIPTRDIRFMEIGFLGEFFVHRILEQHIDGWSHENWTSKLRVEAGYVPFPGPEKNFSDFTYLDQFGHMKDLLREAGMEVVAEWSHGTKFHLEVKTTSGGCSEPCFVSQRQLDRMREHDKDPYNAYILIRVFEVDSTDGPKIRLFQDPWSLYMERVLDFRSEEGYKVYGLE